LKVGASPSVEEAAQGIFGVSAKDLTVPQSAFIAGLPQSPIVYSPYAADGSLKSEGDMALGLERAKDVLYNMYRTGHLSEKEYKEYKDYDLTKDFSSQFLVGFDSVVVFQLLLRNIVPLNQVFVHGLLGFFLSPPQSTRTFILLCKMQ